jgi:predicted DNA-binding mobile mystery protein A
MNKIRIEQVDRFLKRINVLKSTEYPKNGWIKYIRNAIGMTALQLAKRMKVSRRRITKIEEDELQDALTIKTLKAIANAMDCQFVYAILPKTTIKQTIEEQAKKIALQHMAEVSHHMNLEKQGVLDKKILELQLEALVKQYIDKTPKHLWDV